MRDTGWHGPGRGGPLLLVLLAHGLLLGLLTVTLQRAPRFAVPRAVAPALNLIWLREQQLPAPPPAAADPRLTRKPPPTALAAQPETPQLTPNRPTAEPQAITLSPAPAVPAAGASAPTSGAAAPLDLRLPSQRASQPLPAAALTRDDPRVRERLSYGERMARGIGTDNTLHEEALPDGSRRFSQGTGCVVARPSRISELDSFNNSASPKPRSIGPC